MAEDDGLFSWVVVERGEQLVRRSTYNRNELLYWVFAEVIFPMASRYEVDHRQEDEDPRRLLFAHQLELLNRLDPQWSERQIEEVGSLLDEVGRRSR